MFGILFDGAYLLIDHLGSGMYATVELVRHLKSGQLFARKLTRFSHPRYLAEAEAEAGNQPSVPGTTHLKTAFVYPVNKPTNQPETGERGHMAMILNYVNGGTVFDLVGDIQEQNHASSGQGQKLPEHFIWKCMADMINCHLRLATKSPYLIHRDVHEQNWLFQWPTTAPGSLPDLTLADFGLAETYGHIDKLINAVSNTTARSAVDSAFEPYQIEKLNQWWEHLMNDLRSSFYVLAYMMVNPMLPETELEDPMRTFLEATILGVPFHGYSIDLIETAWRWFSLSVHSTADVSAAEICNRMQVIRELSAVAESKAIQTQATYDPGRSDLNMAKLAPSAADQIPAAMWATAEELMPLRPPSSCDNYPDRTDIELDNQGSGLRETVNLRYGQYEVVEFLGMKGEEYLIKTVPVVWREPSVGKAKGR